MVSTRKKSKAAAAAAEEEPRERVEEKDEASSSSSVEAEEDAAGESSGEESGSEHGEDGEGDGSSDDDDEEESSGEEEEEEGGSAPQSEDRADPNTDMNMNGGEEQCTFDLTNLLAFNTHQVNAAALYPKKQAKHPHQEWYAASPTIASSGSTVAQALPHVDEALLLSKAAEGTTQLLAELWKLPTEKTDVGPMAKLPSVAETKLPRSLPPPPPKQLTKWEQFALQRGIAPKSKRSRKVFDEDTGTWKHLTGSLQTKANAGPESWPILEVKKNDDPMADPWEKLREEKKGRVAKNVEARMRNAEREGTLERGSANKLVKNNKRLEKQRALIKERDRQRGLVAPVGVPLDVQSNAKRGKASTQLALKATQVSTASLGRFDKMREGEPERKQQMAKTVHGKKRKQQLDGAAADGGGGGTNKKFLQSEAQKSVDILQRVMNGSSSKEKERDVRKGKFARGETAYDYEFDDGLGAGSFKKKKGRAGMGKMRKVTKKRIK